MPDLLPKDTPEKERNFAEGREVDELSKKLFSEGVDIKGYNQEGWENTKKALMGSYRVLFQPTVIAGPLTCRADILTKSKKGDSWDINEVKKATTVKEDYIYDVGFQRICFENAGIKIGRTNLVHINRDYVRHGEIEVGKLFISEDITNKVNKKLPAIEEEIEKALEILKIQSRPNLQLINGCSNPKRCKYLECYCKGVPEIHSIADKISQEHLLSLLNREILNPKKIQPDILKSIGYESKEEFTRIDASAIRRELKKLEYPLYFFDYETHKSAIPLFDGTKPYQQIPFQYSLMKKDSPTAPVEHTEFLMHRFENPMSDLLSQLKRDLGPKGSVIVWCATFEMSRNKEMAKMRPLFADFLKSVNRRIFDLMLIFKFKNHMYNKSEFKELASLKIILPVLCPELSYDTLAIREGGEASASWPVLISDKISAKEKLQIEKDMLTYCKRDTEAMVGILDRVIKDIK
ncbi:DUF2779 domain-containing protein [Patescibacteria group bacterium]|nr:DUF2779 domain-containing protein [Patescibacteria group bacterium]